MQTSMLSQKLAIMTSLAKVHQLTKGQNSHLCIFLSSDSIVTFLQEMTLLYLIKILFSTSPNNCILLGCQSAVYNGCHADAIIRIVPTFNKPRIIAKIWASSAIKEVDLYQAISQYQEGSSLPFLKISVILEEKSKGYWLL